MLRSVPEPDGNRTPSLQEAFGKKKDERAPALMELMRVALRARHRISWRWQRDRAFVQNKPYGIKRRSKGGGSRWDATPHARAEVIALRVSINHLSKISDQVRAVLTQERPAFDALAGSDEGKDMHSARHASAVLRWMWRQYMLEDFVADGFQGSFNEGIKIPWVYWDPQGGPVVTREVETTPAKTEMVKIDALSEEVEVITDPAVMGEEEQRVGELIFKMLDPEQVIVPAYSRNDQDWEWQAVREYITLQEIENRFGVAARNKVTIDRSEPEGDWGYDHGTRYPGVATTADAASDLEILQVITLYVRSSEKWPRGRKAIFTKAIMLEDADADDDNPVYATADEPESMWPRYAAPLFPLRWEKDSDHFYGRSGLDDLIPLQKELNGVETKIKVICAKHSHARRKIPKGTRDVLSDDPMAAIEYSPIFGKDSIGWEQPPTFPQELLSQSVSLRTQMEDISGINKAIQGVARAEDSGIKVREQQQRAEGRLGPKKARFDRVIGNMMLHALILIRRHLDFDMQMLIVGDNGETSARVFQRARLSGNLDVYPVNNPLSSDPMTKVTQLNQIAQMVTTLPDPSMANRFLALLNLSDTLRVEHHLDIHRERAEDENEGMRLAQPPEVYYFDHDMTHLTEHYDLALSKEGRKLFIPEPDDPPEIAEMKQMRQQLLFQHIQEHEEALREKSGQQAAPPAAGGAQPPSQDQGSGSAAQPRPAIA